MTVNLASIPIEKEIKQIQICEYDKHPKFKTLNIDYVRSNMFTERSHMYNTVLCEIEFSINRDTLIRDGAVSKLLTFNSVVIKIQDRVFGYPRFREPIFLYLKQITTETVLFATHKFEVSRTKINGFVFR
jgi:hypothetical protein